MNKVVITLSLVSRRLALTDSRRSQQPAESPEGSQQHTSLPEGFSPWEGSAMAVKQGTHWSSALIWLSVVLFGGAVLWMFTARMDQTITVRGKLEPASSVEEVDVPAAGVVSRVLVKEGQQVKAGTPLIAIEAKGLNSRRDAVLTTIEILEAQNRSLQRIISNQGNDASVLPSPILPEGIEPALRAKLTTAVEQTQQVRAKLLQIDARLRSKEETLKLAQKIEADLYPLYKNGGYSRIQYLNQRNNVQEQKAEVASLREERISTLGSVSGQINANNRELEALKSELVKLREDLSYRVIKAPVSGKIFDLKASPSAVLSADQVVLKIVPKSSLVAKVNITNADIGFVRQGLPVTVGVDSFPAGEFGYIKGTLESIGSDALPPDPKDPYYRFPATVSLQQQEVESGGKRLNLQSGMSVSANIKLRSRPVVNIISDMFTKQLEGVKRFR